MLSFVCDYCEAAHENILNRIAVTNYDKNPGYGADDFCISASDKIKAACNCPDAEVYFLVGGTQTNQFVIDTTLQPFQGVVAASTGHIGTHEAGAIEYTGHKVLSLPEHEGKIDASELDKMCEIFYADGNHEHMVFPGMVYISHPTEYGTLYTKKELQDLRRICDKYDMPLYMDGARLGYALACPESDVSLADIAALTDMFYIGGTKVGALFGEALVYTKKNAPSHFYGRLKQHGALLAKGWLLGLQFDELFTDGLYEKLGANAIEKAAALKNALTAKGYTFLMNSPTNQIFVVLENKKMEELSKKVNFSFWETIDADHTAVRFCTSWATRADDLAELIKIL